MTTEDPGCGGLMPVGRGDSLTDKVYRQLRDSLMRGRFMPGQRLVHRTIAAQLEVSQTPVREALLRLASESALAFDPRGIVCVPQLEPMRYAEILALRIELEGRAAEQAARRATSDAIRAMTEIHRKMAAAKAAGDVEEVLAGNERFHFSIIDLADMPVLRRLVESLWMQCGPTIRLLYDKPVRAAPDKHAHLSLLRALARNDPAAARDALTEDLQTNGKHILDRLAERMITGESR